MSNNVFFFKHIYTISVRGVENWIATVWKCLFALLRIPEMLPAGLHPVRWTDESRRREGEEDHERRLWYLMISQCVPRARTNLFYVWCVAQYHNGHTNPFSSLRAKFSKMLEHFQKWPLSKASFGVRDCKNPSISVPSEAIRHCDPELFQNSFHGCQNLEFPIELLWLYRLQINITSRIIKFSFSLCHFLKFYSLKFLIFNYNLIILIILKYPYIIYAFIC